MRRETANVMTIDVINVESRAGLDFLDIDLASEQGAALLHAVADRHGASIARAATLASRLFLLRSPWAPGLRFVGGETRAAKCQDRAGVFNLSGAGETLEARPDAPPRRTENGRCRRPARCRG
jgi:hypothetical protein